MVYKLYERKIATYISNLVNITSTRKNLHLALSKSTDLKAK